MRQFDESVKKIAVFQVGANKTCDATELNLKQNEVFRVLIYSNSKDMFSASLKYIHNPFPLYLPHSPTTTPFVPPARSSPFVTCPVPVRDADRVLVTPLELRFSMTGGDGLLCVSESFGCSLPFRPSTPLPSERSPSIRYPIPTQEAGNGLVYRLG
ncbi:hypothetical protein EVAR_78872_1 [Eumeta japonica]|uniref:Uncharacterized protein n=1 Tax=Eumeta variegata TaxID=151549 RepID=A0A4C1U2B2_EUMVA|nr:hypothetical protein EVAR_78872_1 [Eumeta japonica]